MNLKWNQDKKNLLYTYLKIPRTPSAPTLPVIVRIWDLTKELIYYTLMNDILGIWINIWIWSGREYYRLTYNLVQGCNTCRIIKKYFLKFKKCTHRNSWAISRCAFNHFALVYSKTYSLMHNYYTYWIIYKSLFSKKNY